jgi:nucleotide-binding universal stress UspA family protein
MKSPLHIFVPVDFKARSVNAVKRAVELANLLESKLFICHVYNRPYIILDPDLGYDEDTVIRIENYSLRRIAEKVDEHFDELVKEVPELTTVAHECVKEIGSVVDTIVNSVEKYEIDLIIMGTRGLSGLKELFGNKTSDVVEQVSCPVLVIHEEVQKLNLDKIAIACDLCKMDDLSCLDILKEIIRAAHSDVDVVHITKSEKAKEGKTHPDRETIKLNWHIKNHRKPVKYCCNPKDEKGLMEFIDQNEIGLLAMLPEESSFFENLIHESLTHKMTFHAKVPLLTLH